MKVCHLIGNGPSAKLFDGRSGDIYGCNYPKFDLDYKACGFVDQSFPYWVDATGHTGHWEWWTFTELHEHVKKWDLMKGLTVEPHLEFMPNTGQMMAKRLSSMYEEVHLWGFDSLYSTSTASLTDKNFTKSLSTRARTLDIFWRRWFEENCSPHGSFVCHMPDNAFAMDPPQNVNLIQTAAPDVPPKELETLSFLSRSLHPLNYAHLVTIDHEGEDYEIWYGDIQTVNRLKKEREDAKAQEVRDT